VRASGLALTTRWTCPYARPPSPTSKSTERVSVAGPVIDWTCGRARSAASNDRRLSSAKTSPFKWRMWPGSRSGVTGAHRRSQTSIVVVCGAPSRQQPSPICSSVVQVSRRPSSPSVRMVDRPALSESQVSMGGASTTTLDRRARNGARIDRVECEYSLDADQRRPTCVPHDDVDVQGLEDASRGRSGVALVDEQDALRSLEREGDGVVPSRAAEVGPRDIPNGDATRNQLAHFGPRAHDAAMEDAGVLVRPLRGPHPQDVGLSPSLGTERDPRVRIE